MAVDVEQVYRVRVRVVHMRVAGKMVNVSAQGIEEDVVVTAYSESQARGAAVAYMADCGSLVDVVSVAEVRGW